MGFNLREFLAERKLHEAEMVCPLPTQDLKLNTKNRNSAIKADYIQYGPLNLNEQLNTGILQLKWLKNQSVKIVLHLTFQREC